MDEGVNKGAGDGGKGEMKRCGRAEWDRLLEGWMDEQIHGMNMHGEP